ncbi:MAG: T9SS type A sorting domain-containing protein [Prolixibacteraceae bacterium]|nr:T9SS type A sorting domain-containing protein [Prolixibacteraceae bacterium]
MKKLLFITVTVCFLAFNSYAQDNKALHIFGDGTSFFMAGLDELIVSDLTIEGWVKIDGGVTLDDYTALVDFRDASTGDSKALIFKNSDGPTISYEWGGNWTYISAENYLVPDEWQHVALVIDGIDAEARFYVNGFQTGSDVSYSGLGDELTLGENMRVGAGLGTEPIRTLIGVMDEIRIWTVIRTEDEIFENMAREIDPSTDGLLMYYRCNEESDATLLTDATGNGYDLPVDGDVFAYEFVDDTEWNTDETGVFDLKNSNVFYPFPNPVKNQLRFEGLKNETSVIKVLDLSGCLILEKQMTSSELDVSELQKGLYFVEIKQETETYKGRFIKE